MAEKSKKEQIAELKKKIAARDGKPGFKGNVAVLKDRLAKLQGVDEPA